MRQQVTLRSPYGLPPSHLLLEEANFALRAPSVSPAPGRS